MLVWFVWNLSFFDDADFLIGSRSSGRFSFSFCLFVCGRAGDTS